MIFQSTDQKIENLSLRRIALSVQYDGAGFCGWQKQPVGLSVQGVLEEAISSLDPLRPVKAIAAGRTDAGVHAAGQVVHFDCSGPIPVNSWISALNGRLPQTVRVQEAKLRPPSWHACYSAIYRRYRYTIFNACRPNLFLSPWTWHRYKFRLDEELMGVALKGLLGFHDFYAFQRAGSNRSHSWTTIQAVEIERFGDLIIIEIQASGFLYGMVRLLIAQLVDLGEHKINLETFERRWKERIRSEVKIAAPAKGLCLIRAGYEESIFSEAAWHDTFPKQMLANVDSPRLPPEFDC